MPTDIIMPQMGESIVEGTITKWLKKPGDKIQRDGASWIAPLEFLSEVFVDGKPLTKQQFEKDAKQTDRVFVDLRGAALDDQAEARDYAARVVQSFTNERSLEDWRDWILHVSDDQGDELFVVRFVIVLGKPH